MDKKIKIYNGDCLEVMDNLIAEGKSVNAVVTSPPYNIIRPSSTDMGYDIYNDDKTNDEYISWTNSIFLKFDKLLEKDGVILYNMSYGSENTTTMSLTIASIIQNTNFTIADIIVWKKKTAIPNNVSKNKLTRIVEFIYVFVRKDEFKTFNTNKKISGISKVGQKIYNGEFNFIEADNNDCSTSLNKATYSTDLVNKLFALYIKDGSTVLDPFNGTGTTGVVAKQHNCKYYGIELSKEQCEYSKNRINKVRELQEWVW